VHYPGAEDLATTGGTVRSCPIRARQEGHPRRFTVIHGATDVARDLYGRRFCGRGHLLCKQGIRGSSPLSSTRRNVSRQDRQQPIDTPVYFADPHSPWQRPSNENTNGLLRQYFPKGTDLARWSAEEIEAVATTLNNRPRKTLGWKTPAEALSEQLLSLQNGVASAG